MAQPVWVLSVDLQTKTATFQSGLADAARSARGAFSDIKGGAGEMGGRVSYSMTEARHSVVLLGEEFGIHLPRAVSTFIAGLGPVGAAMETAFPFLIIAYGAVQLIEHLEKLRAAGVKLTEDQEKFGTAVNNVFNSLGDKILEAQKRVDDLKGNHLAALKDELELIDHQSMAELYHAFEELAKASDGVMKGLEGHWYSFGKGSEGAKNALDQFRSQYANLLSENKGEAASGLLHGTLGQAQTVLTLMKQLESAGRTNSFSAFADPAKFHEAADALERMHIAVSPDTMGKQIEAQQNFVDVLNATVGAEQRVASLKALQGQAATLQEGKAGENDAEKKARLAAKLLEIEERIGAEEGRLIAEANAKAAQEMADGERLKIDATREGSAQRLAVVNASIKEEEDAGNQSYGFYRELLSQRVSLIRQMTEEESKLRADAAREDAENQEKLGELSISLVRTHLAAEQAARRETAQQIVAQEIQVAEEEYNGKMAELEREIAGLDKSGNEYLNKLKTLQDKESQLTRQHENDLAAIKEKATQQSNNDIVASYRRMVDDTSRGLTQSIMGHQTWARTLSSLGDQVISGMMENAIKSVMLDDFDKERDAAKAARKFFLAGAQLPFPANLVAAPVLAAGAFAAVMAYEGGTDRVPGVGRGDVVPSMLTPGEGIVPGGVMDGLRNVARNGGFGGGGTQIHMHGVSFAPTVHALDASGVDKVLDKHADKFQARFETVLRKMNR